MLEETLQIHNKYMYFSFSIAHNGYDLFRNNKNDIDIETFDNLNYIYYMQFKIKQPWRNYRSTRSTILKKIEKKKYEVAIRPYFCHDIKNLILRFILYKKNNL